MSRKTYGQICGVARALEVVGERWTLLIIRELLVEPKRFNDLARGLRGIPPSLLTSRLEELRDFGLVARRDLPPPASATVYELTEAGAALRPAVVELGRWGARYGRLPLQSDETRAEWVADALKELVGTDMVKGNTGRFALHVDGSPFAVEIEDRQVRVVPGEPREPRAVVSGAACDFLSALCSPAQLELVLDENRVSITGDKRAARKLLTALAGARGGKAVATPQGHASAKK